MDFLDAVRFKAGLDRGNPGRLPLMDRLKSVDRTGGFFG
jgi:hypothetical protein